jgi:hypothetical protein
MGYKLRITVEVVDDQNECVDHRGMPSVSANAIQATRLFTEDYHRVGDAHNALNLTWAFLHPIDSALSRHKG